MKFDISFSSCRFGLLTSITFRDGCQQLHQPVHPSPLPPPLRTGILPFSVKHEPPPTPTPPTLLMTSHSNWFSPPKNLQPPSTGSVSAAFPGNRLAFPDSSSASTGPIPTPWMRSGVQERIPVAQSSPAPRSNWNSDSRTPLAREKDMRMSFDDMDDDSHPRDSIPTVLEATNDKKRKIDRGLNKLKPPPRKPIAKKVVSRGGEATKGNMAAIVRKYRSFDILGSLHLNVSLYLSSVACLLSRSNARKSTGAMQAQSPVVSALSAKSSVRRADGEIVPPAPKRPKYEEHSLTTMTTSGKLDLVKLANSFSTCVLFRCGLRAQLDRIVHVGPDETKTRWTIRVTRMFPHHLRKLPVRINRLDSRSRWRLSWSRINGLQRSVRTVNNSSSRSAVATLLPTDLRCKSRDLPLLSCPPMTSSFATFEVKSSACRRTFLISIFGAVLNLLQIRLLAPIMDQ